MDKQNSRKSLQTKSKYNPVNKQKKLAQVSSKLKISTQMETRVEANG